MIPEQAQTQWVDGVDIYDRLRTRQGREGQVLVPLSDDTGWLVKWGSSDYGPVRWEQIESIHGNAASKDTSPR